MTGCKAYALFVIFLVIFFTCPIRLTSASAAVSNVQANENSHRTRTRPYLRLARPVNQYARLKVDDFLDDDEFFELNKRQTSDDYGHLRFGKRDEFDDYGHMRFGRSGSDATN